MVDCIEAMGDYCDLLDGTRDVNKGAMSSGFVFQIKNKGQNDFIGGVPSLLSSSQDPGQDEMASTRWSREYKSRRTPDCY